MKVKLWENQIPFEAEGCEIPNQMTAYLIDTDVPTPCVVIFPGGGYHRRAPHEGEPIAQFFNTRGIQAMVVDYRVGPNRFPTGLADAQRAVRLVRAHAKEWNIDPDRVVTCGFSAGGHLAASTILYGDVLEQGWEREAVDAIDFLPNGAILGYPVISVKEDYGHVNSGKQLLGEERYRTDASDFCLAQYVTEKTPKVFLWHTSDDPLVSVKNSLIFGEHLRDCGVPFEMHIYPCGPHGLGLAKQYEDIKGWADLAADWVLKNI